MEDTVGCGDMTGGGNDWPVRKAQILYMAHLNHALRHTMARITTAQGARHVSKMLPAMAITTRKETKNENSRYGMERITAARNAFNISSDGAGIDLGSEDWMMVKSVTTICSVLSVAGGFSGCDLKRHRQVATRPKISNGRNLLSQQKHEKRTKH